MNTNTKQEELARSVDSILFHSQVDIGKIGQFYHTPVLEGIVDIINAEVTSVLSELEKKAVQYVDGTNTVSVSYFQSIKEKYDFL